MVAPQHEEGGRVTDLQGPQVQHTLQHKRTKVTYWLNHIQWKHTYMYMWQSRVEILLHILIALLGSKRCNTNFH